MPTVCIKGSEYRSLAVSFLLLGVSLALAGQARSPVEFTNGLEGSHKGIKTEGVLQLRQYLERYGYLQRSHSGHHAEDYDGEQFDDLLEEAVKAYQQNYGLEVTGTLDCRTVSLMMRPRCGVPDIIHGTNSIHSGGEDEPPRTTVPPCSQSLPIL